jgi:hypothetical protein
VQPRRTRRSSRLLLLLLAVGIFAVLAGFIWLIATGVGALIDLFR